MKVKVTEGNRSKDIQSQDNMVASSDQRQRNIVSNNNNKNKNKNNNPRGPKQQKKVARDPEPQGPQGPALDVKEANTQKYTRNQRGKGRRWDRKHHPQSDMNVDFHVERETFDDSEDEPVGPPPPLSPSEITDEIHSLSRDGLSEEEYNRRVSYIRVMRKPYDPKCGECQLYVEKEVRITPPFELVEELSNVVKHVDLPEDSEDYEFAVDMLENIFVYAYNLSKSTSVLDYTLHTMTFIKLYVKGSVLYALKRIIEDYSNSESEELQPQSWNVRDIENHWDHLKTNTVFKKISFLITVGMASSICAVKKITLDPFGLKLIQLEAAKEQAKAVDVVDAMIVTFRWLVDSGIQAMSEKSIRPFIYSDVRTREYNKEVDHVLAISGTVLAGNGEDLNDFEVKVDECLKATARRKSLQPHGASAYWLQQRYVALVEVKEKILCRRKHTAIRESPFGMGLTGSSGVGKSTLGQIVMSQALQSMGYGYVPERVITYDTVDKYDSSVTSDVNGMFIDDVGNGKPDFEEKSPSNLIIKFFNNICAPAVKAELNEKGVVFFQFKVGVLTSNFVDYNVRQYTYKPEASLRRLFHTRVKIKPEYCKSGSVSLDTDHPDIVSSEVCKDVWLLTIEETHITEGKNGDKYVFRVLDVTVDPVYDENGQLVSPQETIYCKDLDLNTYLRVVSHLAKRHKNKQSKLVKDSVKMHDIPVCSKCGILQPACKCLKPQSMQYVIEEYLIPPLKTAILNTLFSPFYWALPPLPVKKLATKFLISEFEDLSEVLKTGIMSHCPDCIYDNVIVDKIFGTWIRASVDIDLREWYKRNIWRCIYSLPVFWYFSLSFLCWIWLVCGITILLCPMRYYRLKCVKQELLLRRDVMPTEVRARRDKLFKIGVGATVLFTVISYALSKYRESRNKRLEPQMLGSDNIPTWSGFMYKPMQLLGLKTQTAVRDSAPEHVSKTIVKSGVFWCQLLTEDYEPLGFVNIFFPEKWIALLPRHVFYEHARVSNGIITRPIRVIVYRHGAAGGKFEFIVHKDHVVISEHMDMAMVFVPNCPDVKDHTKWLPLTKPSGRSRCMIIGRHKSEVFSDIVAVTHETVTDLSYCDDHIYGGHYNTDQQRVGICMSPLILCEKSPVIVGFHVAGTSSGSCAMQTVTLGDYQQMRNQLEEKPGVLISSQTGKIPDQQYGRSLLSSTEPHPKSVFVTLNNDYQLEVLGSVKLRAQQKSTVKDSVISELVTKHFGVENKWGAPKLVPNWQVYNETLEHVAKPGIMFDPTLLERARVDWVTPLRSLMEEYVNHEDFRPLTMQETVMGVPGKRFLDPIPMSTSLGFPLFGKKSTMFTDIYNDQGQLVDREPAPEILEEVDRLISCWKAGERGYPVCSATLKDEVVEKDSEKVRVFMAGSIALGLCIRKYFLPLARFLGKHPLESECAVGLNSFSPEWGELMDHVESKSKENVLAWDYSKFDAKMNAQVTSTYYLSLIELAQIGGYSSEDLFIMKMMVSDIVHPMIDWNGTMVMTYSMNTSGNNMTVWTNCGANSLYVRMGFFSEYPECDDFREHVANTTYGDDFIGTIVDTHTNFNCLSFREFMAKHKVKITSPDKKTELDKFGQLENTDFLKRKSVYIPEIGCRLGALDEDSIFKALHANMASSQLPESVSTSCMETAAHEWFAHGRKKYEERIVQLQALCEEAKLPVPAAWATFDERVAHWKEKYCSQS